jgi:hypothetical protein
LSADFLVVVDDKQLGFVNRLLDGLKGEGSGTSKRREYAN